MESSRPWIKHFHNNAIRMRRFPSIRLEITGACLHALGEINLDFMHGFCHLFGFQSQE